MEHTHQGMLLKAHTHTHTQTNKHIRTHATKCTDNYMIQQRYRGCDTAARCGGMIYGSDVTA